MHQTTTKQRRIKRVRAKIRGTSDCPRLSVFRSNVHIYAQLIDDGGMKTLVAGRGPKHTGEKIGEELAKKALAKKIKKVTFDRNGYKYHGRVKALADGARKGGLEF